MGTRSLIGMEQKNGTVKFTYCHWDGYIEHNGIILERYYNDENAVKELLNFGQISSLGANIGEKHAFNGITGVITDTEIGKKLNKICTFYHRDRGDDMRKAENVNSLTDYIEQMDVYGAEFAYVFSGGKWYYSTGKGFEILSESVEELKKEAISA